MFLKSQTGFWQPAFHRSSTQNSCFWIIYKIHMKKVSWSLFLIKLQFWGPATLLKKTSTQLLSWETWKLFKSNYFEEHLWTSASKHYLKRDSNTSAFRWILLIIQEHLFSRGSTNGLFWNPSEEVFLLKSCKPDGVKTFNSVRKRLSHRYFSVNFEKFLGKLFCRTPPSNHFSHDVVFFLFADQWGLQPKINLFGGAIVN